MSGPKATAPTSLIRIGVPFFAVSGADGTFGFDHDDLISLPSTLEGYALRRAELCSRESRTGTGVWAGLKPVDEAVEEKSE